jgi:hypothetical protein
MFNGIPPLETAEAFVVIIIGGIHVWNEVKHLHTLHLAWRALSPEPDIMPGECCYKLQRPEKGPIEELYCMNPHRNRRLPRVIEELATCKTCERRVLPYKGYQYLDQIHLEGFGASVFQRLLSISTWVLVIWLVFSRLH